MEKTYTDACLKLVELAADGIDVRTYASELRAAYAATDAARFKRAVAKVNETYRYA